MSTSSSPSAIKNIEILECDLHSPAIPARSTAQGPPRRFSDDQFDVIRDATNYMKSLTIYESMFNPTLTGEMRVQDDINLSSILPLVGLENLSLRFRIFVDATTRPNGTTTNNWRYYPHGANDTSDSRKLLFAIYNQTERVPQTQATETYRLGLASPELMSSTEKRFSFAFKNLRVEQVLSRIMRDYLNTRKNYGTATAPDGQPYFEQTASLQTAPFQFVAPYISPLGAIKLATLLAYVPDSISPKANFFFYETLDGFYFRSLQQIIQKGKERYNANPVRIVRKMGGVSATRGNGNVINAEQIDIVSNFDYLYALSQGYFASTTIGVDVLSGEYRTKTSKFSDAGFTARTRLNTNRLYPSRLEEVSNPTARVFLVPTTSISATNPLIGSNNRPPENFLEQTLALRNRELLELQMFTIRVKVAGAPNINVGSVVYIEIPQVLNNDTVSGGLQDFRSGRYLIVAVKHTLINKGGGSFHYETVFEACSDSTLL